MERQVPNGFAGASSGSGLGDDSIEKGPVRALFVIFFQALRRASKGVRSYGVGRQLQETAPLRI